MTGEGMTEAGLAVVTGASSGIGRELARCAARAGHPLLICADSAEIDTVAEELYAREGAVVEALVADLSTRAEVDRLAQAVGDRPVALLMANAGIGLGGESFLDQDIRAALDVLNTNVGGTLCLIHAFGPRMRAAGEGRILITGSVAGLLPGSCHAVYNGTKAFLDNFATALRDELTDSGVTVTCLMPGPTDTRFFDRAGMQDTALAQGRKEDPAEVAQKGFAAMMAGEAGVVTGLRNKVQAAVAGLLPGAAKARLHRQAARSGKGAGPAGPDGGG